MSSDLSLTPVYSFIAEDAFISFEESCAAAAQPNSKRECYLAFRIFSSFWKKGHQTSYQIDKKINVIFFKDRQKYFINNHEIKNTYLTSFLILASAVGTVAIRFQLFFLWCALGTSVLLCTIPLVYQGMKASYLQYQLRQQILDQRRKGFCEGFKEVRSEINPTTLTPAFLEKELTLLYLIHILALSKRINPDLELPKHIQKLLPSYGQMTSNELLDELLEGGAFSFGVVSRLGLIDTPFYRENQKTFERLEVLCESVDQINPSYTVLREEKKREIASEVQALVLSLAASAQRQFEVENRPIHESKK